MGEELLVKEQIDAGADFIRQFDAVFPVTVACWVKPADSENLYLYVASDVIDDSNRRAAYGEALRIFRHWQTQWLDQFQVRLLNSSDPIALDAIQIRDRYPTPQATRYRGTFLGGMGIEGAYVYPPLPALMSP